jgi:hypothetical protein
MVSRSNRNTWHLFHPTGSNASRQLPAHEPSVPTTEFPTPIVDILTACVEQGPVSELTTGRQENERMRLSVATGYSSASNAPQSGHSPSTIVICASHSGQKSR